MFTDEALTVDRQWQLEEVPPEIRALLGDDRSAELTTKPGLHSR